METVKKLDIDMEKLLNHFISGIDEMQRQSFLDTLEQLYWKIKKKMGILTNKIRKIWI